MTPGTSIREMPRERVDEFGGIPEQRSLSEQPSMEPRQCPRAIARVWVAHLGACNKNDVRETCPAQLGPDGLRGSQKGMQSFPCLKKEACTDSRCRRDTGIFHVQVVGWVLVNKYTQPGQQPGQDKN